jgi:integrase/recombinase XerD
MTSLRECTYNNLQCFVYLDNKGKLINLPSLFAYSLVVNLYKPKTVKEYLKRLKCFLDFLEQEIIPPGVTIDNFLKFSSLHRKTVERWRRFEADNNTLAITTNHREIVLRKFFIFLTSEDAGRVVSERDNPYKSGRLLTRRKNKTEPKYLHLAEIINLLLNFHHECERCMHHLMYDTGIRVEELIKLKKKFLPQLIKGRGVFYMKVDNGKQSLGYEREGKVKISEAVLERIYTYQNTLEYLSIDNWAIDDPEKPMFFSATGKELKYENIYSQMKMAAKRAGIDGRSVSPHKLRHSASYNILTSDEGNYWDRYHISNIQLRHSNFASTYPYSAIRQEELVDPDFKPRNREKEARIILNATYKPSQRKSRKIH